MENTIFRIVYEFRTILGTVKQKEAFLKEDEAFQLINKCHRRKHRIITIQHF